MDVLYLSEADVERLLTMEMALAAVEGAFRRASQGLIQNHARRRLHTGKGSLLHYMAAEDVELGYMGMKIYTSSRAGLNFLVPLYRNDTGEMVALLEADYLSRMRTGAATGVATKYMARPEAASLGLIGTGHQAPTQLLAVAQVRPLQSVRVYSRTPERCTAFAEKMRRQLDVPVAAAESAEEAVRDADIVAAITSARQPVVQGAWLSAGVHVNAAGINSAKKREIDEEVVRRASRIVVDSVEQSKEEAGDLIIPFAAEPEHWQSVRTLAEVVGGTFSGRDSPEEITLFKSNGVALEDVATAAVVYERAREQRIGRRMRMWDTKAN